MPDKFICIIPARFKSSRFEGKPLALINGKPMIQWVIEHALSSKKIKRVLVATDDDLIFNTVKGIGYEAIMTSPDCLSGSDRVAEVATNIASDWIFEMQGDQPMVTAATIDYFIEQAIRQISTIMDVDVVIPYAPITQEDRMSPDVLKVVRTESERLVFQTRHPIDSGFRTLGLYLWKKESLLRFASLPRSDIEISEDSHPIRLYVNDFKVQGLLISDNKWIEVDRPEHILQVQDFLKNR